MRDTTIVHAAGAWTVGARRGVWRYLALVPIMFVVSCGSDSLPTAVPAAATAAPTVIPSVVPVETQTNAATATAPPTVTPTATQVPVVELMRTRLEYGSEPDQVGLLSYPVGTPPTAGFPVVVLIHGGFWRQQFDASLMDALADDLAERGYASWNIEYRRVGGAGGWPETGDDVAAAIDHLADVGATYPIDLDRVVSVGHSAGGHLGLWALGQQGRVQVRGSVGLGAVVDLAYFSQAHGLLGGTIDEVPVVYADAAPVLDPARVVLIQGSNDTIVPDASLQVARGQGVPIVTVDGEDHFDLIDPASNSWTAAIAAIERSMVLAE